jgi:hypothetical protein
MDALREKQIEILRQDLDLAKHARTDAGRAVINLIEEEKKTIRDTFEKRKFTGMSVYEVAGHAVAYQEIMATLDNLTSRLIGAAERETQTADELASILKEEVE